MESRPGCLSGLLKLFMVGWLFDWLQDKFGFGKGCSCSGLGCGIILLVIFIGVACSIIFGTNWLQLNF